MSSTHREELALLRALVAEHGSEEHAIAVRALAGWLLRADQINERHGTMCNAIDKLRAEVERLQTENREGSMGSEVQKCRSCGAPILWVRTTTGKAMPVDAKPEKRIVLDPADTGQPTGRVVDTYVSHFATCPHAAKHRRS